MSNIYNRRIVTQDFQLQRLVKNRMWPSSNDSRKNITNNSVYLHAFLLWRFIDWLRAGLNAETKSNRWAISAWRVQICRAMSNDLQSRTVCTFREFPSHTLTSTHAPTRTHAHTHTSMRPCDFSDCNRLRLADLQTTSATVTWCCLHSPRPRSHHLFCLFVFAGDSSCATIR
jgi:hypothetical protein